MQTTGTEKIKRPRLANVKQMSIDYPEQCHYWDEEIKLMKVGDIAKIANSWERFWVVVKEISDKWIVGEVNNLLITEGSPDVGELLLFKRENIYEVWDLQEFKDFWKKK